MQFSKKVSQLARTHGIEEKDVLFALLLAAGAAAAESFAVIFRPAATTNNTLAAKAAYHIGQLPGLGKLIEELNDEKVNPNLSPAAKPVKPKSPKSHTSTDKPSLDYTDKDAVLQELARIAERSDKESDKLAAIKEIAAMQRMKQEAAVEEEKRVCVYIPLSYERCDELMQYLEKYYNSKPERRQSFQVLQ